MKTTPIGMWNTSLKADMLPSFWADMVKFWSNSSCLPFLFLKEVRNNQRLQQSEQSQLGLSSTISNEVGAAAMKKSVCPNLWAEPKNKQEGFWRYTKGCNYSHNGIFLKSLQSQIGDNPQYMHAETVWVCGCLFWCMNSDPVLCRTAEYTFYLELWIKTRLIAQVRWNCFQV